MDARNKSGHDEKKNSHHGDTETRTVIASAGGAKRCEKMNACRQARADTKKVTSQSDVPFLRSDFGGDVGVAAAQPRLLERRRAEEVTLEEADAFVAQDRRLLFLLDPFGDDRQVEALGQADEVAQEDLVLGVGREVAHERAVDLDSVDRELLQMTQRGKPGAEIVECHAAAEIAQRAHEARALGDVVQRRGLGDLDDEAAGDLRPVLEDRRDGAQPRAVGRGEAGDVEGEIDRGMLGDFVHRLVEHVAVDQADEAQLLDRGDEIAGGDDLAVLGDHAQQAFAEIDLAGLGRDHRLIGEDQAVLLERALHALAQREAVAVAAALLLAHAIGHEAVAAGALGFRESRFGKRHDVVRGLGLLGKAGCTDRNRRIDGTGGGVDRHLADGRENLFGGDGDVLLGAIGEHDAEAVAADAADDVADAQAAVEPLADLDDDGVGRLVAVGVVDGAELVDADGEIGAGRAGAQAAGDDLVERLAQALFVEVASELVVMRELLEALLDRLARGDEAEHALDAHGLAARRLGRAAIVHPGVVAAVEADAVLAVESAAALDVRSEALVAQRQVVAMDAIGEGLAGRHQAEGQALDGAVPFEAVGGGIPYIGNVAGGRERGQYRSVVSLGFSRHANDVTLNRAQHGARWLSSFPMLKEQFTSRFWLKF